MWSTSPSLLTTQVGGLNLGRPPGPCSLPCPTPAKELRCSTKKFSAAASQLITTTTAAPSHHASRHQISSAQPGPHSFHIFVGYTRSHHATATMHLMYVLDASGKRTYTLKKVLSGEVTKSAHPARFSPDDKWSRQRVTLKKRFGLLILADGEFSALPALAYESPQTCWTCWTPNDADKDALSRRLEQEARHSAMSASDQIRWDTNGARSARPTDVRLWPALTRHFAARGIPVGGFACGRRSWRA
ncbi:hypothetical protein JX266_012328 [Neoarthrinium moseri]|nr:hypothetical protein JX266_012328 [Neoarthrinium moseri]